MSLLWYVCSPASPNTLANLLQSPMIADFVQATASIPLYQIPAHLASFPKLWPFPRGDTYHWIPVLNRFDRILELFNKEYGLEDGPQTQTFQRRLLLKGDAEEGNTAPEQATNDAILDKLHIPQEGDRELIEQILSFTRLLLENCGNRSLYSSSSHLDKLLNTTSTSLVKATLRLSLRLAQRYHSARMRMAPATFHPTLLASHYNFNLDKVQKLAAPFAKGPATSSPVFATPTAKGKEKAFVDRRPESEKISGTDLVGLFALSESSLKQEFGGVVITYYEPSAMSDESSKPASTEAPTTPTPVRRTTNMRPNQTPRQPQNASMPDSPTTPVFTPADTEGARPSGPKTFELSSESVSGTDMHELLKHGLSDLPESAHYELLHKLRIAKAFNSGPSGREDAVAIRLLAIANLGYVHAEKEFYSRVGQQDSDEPRRLQLAYQLSELVHPPGNGGVGLSRELQTFALNAIEALAKHKAKAADVCSALSVNVNHGVLFYVVRKAVAELGVDNDAGESADEDEWRDALFSLLNTLPTSQQRTGEGMVSAGLIEILVEVLKLRTKKAERNYAKVLNFLDTFVYNLRDAFSALVSAKGLDIIADLMSYEVETSQELAKDGKGMPKEFKTQLTDYQIPFYHQQTLRWLFKFMNHMMSHTGGNFDRLMRNLIDSPKLLSGLRAVLSNATIFGSTVWSMAVNILTSFIHNEPTSYQVIVEAGLSEAFLETVAKRSVSEPDAPAAEIDEPVPTVNTEGGSQEQTSSLPKPPRIYSPRSPDSPLAPGILPVAEAIATLPPAFGAICLNEAGMKLFQSSAALRAFFEIFESPAHVKALDVDSEIPGLIGNSFDELVRHHPPLKSQVLSSLSEMIARVVQLCASKAEKEGVGAKLWTEDENGTIFVAGGRQSLQGPKGPLYDQLSNGPSNAGGDIEMQDADDEQPINSLGDEITFEQVVETEDSTAGPTTGQYISVVCRFLGGFFANHSLCAAYIEADGVESLLDFATLPCIDPKSNESRNTSEEFGRVVQVLVEQKPHITVPSILKRAQRALDRLEPLMQHTGKDAFFAPFTSANPAEAQDSSERLETLKHGTEYVKSLVAVHTLVHALTLTFQGQMFNHRSTHNVSSQVNLADMYASLVDSLGRLHRSCVWEEILLQKHMPADWEKETRIKSSGFGAIEADHVLRMGNTEATPSEPTEAAIGEATATEPATTSEDTILSQNSARFKNTQTLRYLLSKIPTGIAPFFQSLGKLLLFRRSLESYQKQCATIVADQLAQAAIDQLQFDGPKNAESAEDRYAYWIVILTSMSQLMIENNLERGPHPHALTLILVSFRNLGGLSVLAEIFNTYFQSAVSIVKAQGNEAKEDTQRLLNLSLGGVKIILAFYAQIINTKVLNEASQTTSMQSRPERDRDRPDHFLASQFLVELRYAVIKPVREIWNSELIDKATTSIVKTSINILRTVLDGDAEHGAYKSIDKIPKRNKPIIKPWKARNEELLQRLKDAGYEESLAEEALYRCCDNFNTAREYCQNRVRDIRSSRNPIPQYELSARGPPSASPSRAEVVVPEPADDVSESSDDDTGDDTGDSVDVDAPDTQSVHMEDADVPQPANVQSTETLVPTATDLVGASRDTLAYQKRMAVGNITELVSIDNLDEERAILRKNLIDRSLDILNSHDDVTFELAELISAAVAKAPEPAAMRAEIGNILVQSLISLQTGDDFREHGKKIAASAHLLALVIQDKDFYDAIVDELKSSFSFLLDFIKVFPNQPADESSPWIGQVLLIVERLLAEDQLPHQIQWTPPSGDSQEEATVEEIPEPIVNLDEKNQMFDAIIEVLPHIGKDESLALSVMRVLVMLTRTRKIAARLAEK
jgi:E3 ubiquitin-protein ligase HUWE1